MTLMAVFAHPDDEAYGPGATLARYAADGHRVVLVTLTRGEAGRLGPCADLPAAEVARLRTRELQCAAAALGISELSHHALPDRGLADLSDAEGVALIRREITRYRPGIVIAFEPQGLSRHPDHVTVARWCRRAVENLPDPVRLLYYGISRAMAERAAAVREVTFLTDDAITHALPTERWAEAKHAAIRCHESQLDLWRQFAALPGEPHHFLDTEYFQEAWPSRRVAAPLDDLLR